MFVQLMKVEILIQQVCTVSFLSLFCLLQQNYIKLGIL